MLCSACCPTSVANGRQCHGNVGLNGCCASRLRLEERSHTVAEVPWRCESRDNKNNFWVFENNTPESQRNRVKILTLKRKRNLKKFWFLHCTVTCPIPHYTWLAITSTQLIYLQVFLKTSNTVKPVNYDHRRDWEYVVVFLRWSHLPGLVQKNLNRVVHHGTHHAPARAIIISDRSFQHACGGVIGNDNASGACKHDDRSSGVPLREKLDDRKSVFRSIWRMWSLFPGWFEALGRPPVSAIRISQVVAFSRTHSVHLNPRIEGTEFACPQFSGGRFCQVVARTGSTVLITKTSCLCYSWWTCFFLFLLLSWYVLKRKRDRLKANANDSRLRDD